jgi:hypothetical protein
MRYFLPLLVGLAVLPAQAQYTNRCSTDYFGTTTCRDSYGNRLRIQSDQFGNTTGTYQGFDGSYTRCRSYADYFGNVTTRCY